MMRLALTLLAALVLAFGVIIAANAFVPNPFGAVEVGITFLVSLTLAGLVLRKGPLSKGS